MNLKWSLNIYYILHSWPTLESVQVIFSQMNIKWSITINVSSFILAMSQGGLT